jgi:hypothetical protein
MRREETRKSAGEWVLENGKMWRYRKSQKVLAHVPCRDMLQHVELTSQEQKTGWSREYYEGPTRVGKWCGNTRVVERRGLKRQ